MNSKDILACPQLGDLASTLFAGAMLDSELSTPGILAASAAGYRVLSQLHTSGAWTAWRCIAPGSDREVAIKTAIVDSPYSDEEVEARLSAEFGFMSTLPSPRIVKAVAKSLDGSASYLVSEYAGDDHIAQYAMRKHPADRDGFLSLLLRAIKGVSDLHNAHMIHGDLKPQHFVMRDDLPVLIDFGLSADIQSPMQQFVHPAVLAGTPGYIAPEIVDQRATAHEYTQDVYSLGVMLDRLTSVWCKHSMTKLPGSVRRLIKKATSQDPSNRHSSAIEMLDEYSAAIRPKSARRIATAAASVAVLSTVAFGTSLAIGPSPDGITGREPVQQEPEAPGFYDFDWTSAHVAKGVVRQRFLESLDSLPKEFQGAWEVGLVREGGYYYPFGEQPYGPLPIPPLSWSYAADADALAWVMMGGQVSVMEASDPEDVVTLSNPGVGTIDLRSDGQRLAFVDTSGTVNEWKVGFDLAPSETPLENAKAVHYLGDSLITLGAGNSGVHAWDGVSLQALDASSGVALVLGRGETHVALFGGIDPDSRHVRVCDVSGNSVTPQIRIPFSDGLISADFHAGTGLLCLGTRDGRLLICDTLTEKWRSIDLEIQHRVGAVLLVPEEDRVFVSCLGVHAVSLTDSRRTVTLGGRVGSDSHVTQLAWEASGRSVTIVSSLGVVRWSAQPARLASSD